MVMRIWRAQATVAGAEDYRKLFEKSILPRLQSIDGFKKAYLLNRSNNNQGIDVEVHTLWESVDVIRAFSGSDVDAAVIPPEVQAVVTSCDSIAPHFEIREYEG